MAQSGAARLAIVGGTVLPGGAGGFAADAARVANVLVEGERVVRVDDAPPPPAALVIDAAGLTVLPGLIELHTHVPTPLAMGLYVRQGITSVRFAGSALGVVGKLRDAVRGGALPGPRIFSCGPLLDEPPAAWPGSLELSDAAEARAAVDRVIDAEADALIAVQRIRPATLAAIVEAAHARGVPVTGQTWTTSVREAVELGMDGVENTARLPEDPDLPADWVEGYTSIGHRLARLVALWRNAPQARIDEVIALMAARGTDWAPELCSFAHWAALNDAALMALPGWALLPAADQAALPNARQRTAEGWTDADRDNARAAVERMQACVLSFHRQGGHLGVGTDAHPGGLLYHVELANYAAAGLSTAEVLAAATAGGARALRREAELGRLAPGQLADLIVVDGDPRRDLAALQRVRHTVVGGRAVVADGQLVSAASSEA